MRSPESPTPVIIAAYNEERLVARALGRLRASEVDPILVSNGSNDRTVEVARSFGARVIQLDDKGKLPAQQAAITQLREEGHPSNHPVLFMDADSFPVFPQGWARTMRQYDNSQTPFFRSGLTGYSDGNFVANALRTARRYRLASQVAKGEVDHLRTVFGVNMSVTFGTEDVREQFLDMPHIWPGEDRATANLIIESGGSFEQSTDPRSLVLASARYSPSLIDRLRYGPEYVGEKLTSDYAERRAPTATHQFDTVTKTIIPL